MSDPGRDQDSTLGSHGNFFSIQNDTCIRLAVQNDINFGVFFVIMLACVRADFSQMYREGEFVSICKSPAGYATRAGDSREGSQIENCWLGWQFRRYRRGGSQAVRESGSDAKGKATEIHTRFRVSCPDLRSFTCFCWSSWVQCRPVWPAAADTRQQLLRIQFIPVGRNTPRAEAE